MKHTYNNARSEQYVGDPDLFITQLVIHFMCLYFLLHTFVVVDMVHFSSSQFVDEIFDVYYTPGPVDGINLFELKKRFMYALFTNTLLTDK